MREAEALETLRKGWNPKWVEFLAIRQMVPEDAEKLPRAERTKLNADFMCWNMGNAPVPTNDIKRGGRHDDIGTSG